MTIKAKFPGTCPTCGNPIVAGDRVEWTKGAKATHTSCPTASAPAPKARRSSYREDGYRMTASGPGPMQGCGTCRRLGRMCPSCEFDEFDN